VTPLLPAQSALALAFGHYFQAPIKGVSLTCRRAAWAP